MAFHTESQPPSAMSLIRRGSSITGFIRNLSIPSIRPSEHPLIKRYRSGVNGGSRASLHNTPSVVERMGDNRWQSVFPTVLYCVAALGMGVCHALPAPHAQATALQTATFVISRMTAFFCGTVAGGLILDNVPRQLFLLLFLAVSTACVSLLPFAFELIPSLFLASALGFSLAVLELGSVVFIMDLWGEFSAPFLHIFCFFLAFGAYLIPTFIGPLLLPFAQPLTFHNAVIPPTFYPNHTTPNRLFERNSLSIVPIPFRLHERPAHFTNISQLRLRGQEFWDEFLDSIGTEHHHSNASSSKHHHRRSLAFLFTRQLKVRQVYLFVSAFLLASSLQALLTVAMFHGEFPSQQETKLPQDKAYLEGFLLTAMYFFLMGSSSVQTAVALRCSSHLLFWLAFVGSRFLCILVSLWIPSDRLILSSLTVTLIGLLLYVPADLLLHQPLLKLLASLPIALGCAPLLPSTLAWAEEHLLMSHKRTAFLLMAVFLGEAVLPLSASLPAPVYASAPTVNVLACTALTLLGLGSMLYLHALVQPRREIPVLPRYHCSPLLSSDSGSSDSEG
ncbi:unnamed protein product [Cyprideis torosa]|uniref:Uncharacterized protein n=1 Tax=Cyprideis torosa TaxID=163714 RepID=A0A7R8W4B5_9CRUS|nr:unnamed protein product [Cyprideis torosa]CAG0880464.1 unnamed protein product [Cyprideis torosa]